MTTCWLLSDVLTFSSGMHVRKRLVRAGGLPYAPRVEEFRGLDIRALDRARLSRDARFDGKFFIAVTSTKIYCRPVCPVRSPKRSNIRYYPTAAAAAEAGFRPCLRCRPEAAPDTPAWLGTLGAVRRGLRLIHDGFLDQHSVEELAAHLGIGTRHLHRLFVQHVGASAITVAQTRRLHFAKRLLDETPLPITEIALAAGFGSVRRFNDVFRNTYRRSPREIRRARVTEAITDGTDEVVLRLAYRPPYDWIQVREFLAKRVIPGVEMIENDTYTRTVSTPNGWAVIRVRPSQGEDALEFRVGGADSADLLHLSTVARRVFDLGADPENIDLAFQDDPLLGRLTCRRPGVRIPGVWSPIECAVRAVVGQQVSLRGARTILARLVARTGKPLDAPLPGLTHLFPTPAALRDANLNALGMTSNRIAAIKTLSGAMACRKLDFSRPTAEVVHILTGIPGIGSWSAQYVALRALGDPDAFPSGDLVLRRMASNGNSLMTESALEQCAEAWRP